MHPAEKGRFGARGGEAQGSAWAGSVCWALTWLLLPSEKPLKDYEFAQVLKRSICLEQSTQAWCENCEKYQPTVSALRPAACGTRLGAPPAPPLATGERPGWVLDVPFLGNGGHFLGWGSTGRHLQLPKGRSLGPCLLRHLQLPEHSQARGEALEGGRGSVCLTQR